MRHYEIEKKIRENTARIQHRINTIAYNCTHYPISEITWETMRNQMADFLMKEHATKRVEPYSVVFELDVVVMSPDALEQLLAQASMEYGHMAAMSPMPSVVEPMINSVKRDKPVLVNIPEVTREHISAYKKAYEKCDNDPDDNHSPESRGLEAVFKLLRKGNG